MSIVHWILLNHVLRASEAIRFGKHGMNSRDKPGDDAGW
jgi:hypothetical protein